MTTPYVPPKIWAWTKPSGGRFENINRPVAGATHDKALPRGRHPLQLYSLATPNGVKVTVLLEELLALGLVFTSTVLRNYWCLYTRTFVAESCNTRTAVSSQRARQRRLRISTPGPTSRRA